jgi:ArsR family transcriptional regulator
MIEQDLNRVAGYFKVLADHSRIRILMVLLNGECCVNDLAVCLSMSQSAISHQLRVLRCERLVKSRKAGKQVFYSIADTHVQGVLAVGAEHVNRHYVSGGKLQ